MQHLDIRILLSLRGHPPEAGHPVVLQDGPEQVLGRAARIFLTNNYGLEKQFSDVSLPSVRQRIQQWLDAEGRFPAQGVPGEYGFFAEACYPIAEDRRRYFASLVHGKTPHVGYQLLALLADAGIVKAIWTTNFDGLPAKAVASGVSVTPIEVGP